VKQAQSERGSGLELSYILPCSLGLNPIEKTFSNIKRILRKTEARTSKALVEAMGKAISSTTARRASIVLIATV
jgi:hypothetical protein